MNAFADYADAAKPAWQARKERIAETRKARADERKLAAEREQSEVNKIAAAWRRARMEELKAGPYGKDIRALRHILRTMTLSSAPALIAYVEKAAWLRECDADTRFDVLDMISRGIISLRERNGLPPFDDPLPPETNAFLTIREMLT